MVSPGPLFESGNTRQWGDHAHLVNELRRGNPLALRWIVDTFREPLLAFARQNLSGIEEPEDVVQDAFLRFWTQRDRLRGDGSVRALLYSTVRTISLDEHRRWKRRKQHILETVCTPKHESPLDDILCLELEELADDAIHNLPPRRRAVFQMVRNQGLSYKETAETLGVSPQTVANTMSSALSEIRASLQSILEEPMGEN